MVLILGCTDQGEGDDPYSTRELFNDSNYDILLVDISMSRNDTIKLFKNERTQSLLRGTRGSYFPENSDSILVVFNSTKYIFHRIEFQDAPDDQLMRVYHPVKNVLNDDNYETVERKKFFRYTFTDEDYDQAVPLDSL